MVGALAHPAKQLSWSMPQSPVIAFYFSMIRMDHSTRKTSIRTDPQDRLKDRTNICNEHIALPKGTGGESDANSHKNQAWNSYLRKWFFSIVVLKSISRHRVQPSQTSIVQFISTKCSTSRNKQQHQGDNLKMSHMLDHRSR